MKYQNSTVLESERKENYRNFTRKNVYNHKKSISYQSFVSASTRAPSEDKERTFEMSTRPSMATRARLLIQDQNLLIHNEGGGATGVHGSKVLQKKGPGTRKALANITNSEKPSSHKVSKKNQPTKFANIGVPTIIEEEQCLHNHQSCISLQTAATNIQTAPSIYFQKTLGVDDDANSQLDLWSPKTPSLSSSQGKVGFESTPRYLDFTQTPVLKLQSSVRRSILWSPFSPSMY